MIYRHLSSYAAIVLLSLSLLGIASAVPSLNVARAPAVVNSAISSRPLPVYSTPDNSSKWAGYDVTGGVGAFNGTHGSWIVPAVICSTGKKAPSYQANSMSVFWVGIDGATSASTTVEQTGTASNCVNGKAEYRAWYEFFPDNLQYLDQLPIKGKFPYPVAKNDTIAASVGCVSSSSCATFTVIIEDVTKGWTFTKTGAPPAPDVPLRDSVECIAEAPQVAGITQPLSDFGTVSFGMDNTMVSGTCWAQLSSGMAAPYGVLGGLSGLTLDQITMRVGGTGAVKATTSPLSGDGTSFSVAWVSPGP